MLLESSAPPSFSADRLRPTGKGHRRRSHMSEMSRISVIESIAEEVTSESGSPRAPKFEHPPEPSIVVWDTQSRRNSWRESVDWESEFGVMLRQYYSLQTEAHETVQESQNMWLDTDFSRFALASMSCRLSVFVALLILPLQHFIHLATRQAFKRFSITHRRLSFLCL